MSEARGYRRGLVRGRNLIRTRRALLRDMIDIIRPAPSCNPSIELIQHALAETERCASALDSELERLPRVRGKKYR